MIRSSFAWVQYTKLVKDGGDAIHLAVGPISTLHDLDDPFPSMISCKRSQHIAERPQLTRCLPGCLPSLKTMMAAANWLGQSVGLLAVWDQLFASFSWHPESRIQTPTIQWAKFLKRDWRQGNARPPLYLDPGQISTESRGVKDKERTTHRTSIHTANCGSQAEGAVSRECVSS